MENNDISNGGGILKPPPDYCSPTLIYKSYMAFLLPRDYFHCCGKTDAYRAAIFNKPAFQEAWSLVRPSIVGSPLYGERSSPERYCQVLEDRYTLRDGFYYSLNKVAAIHGVTRERIRQIIARTLRHMNHPKNINLVSSYCYNLGIDNLSFNTQSSPRHNAYLIELASLDCDPNIYDGRRQ